MSSLCSTENDNTADAINNYIDSIQNLNDQK